MRLGRPLIVLLAVAVLVVGLVQALVRLLLPGRMVVEVEPRAPATAALTERLLLVVVDGLRYDFATNPEVMPRFSRAMQQHTSGEVWAARVSMTTSAVLAYATGQPGRLEQVLRNLNPDRTPFNTLFENAKSVGLSTALSGDPTWVQMYGAHIDEALLDPHGVAIDVDFNPKTFSDARTLLAKKPSLMVVHFVTPDHQGHAYGVLSARYAAHLRDFDRQLFELLAEQPKDVTVVVTSDHGATDTGTHGSDSVVQRRCPLFAYGPGIAERGRAHGRVEQVDLAATFAVLLGVASPAHGRGHVVAEWLELDDDTRARLACGEAERAVSYAARVLERSSPAAEDALARCKASSSPSERTELGRQAVRIADGELERATGISSPASWATALLVVAYCIGLLWLALGYVPWTAVIASAALVVPSLVLVYGTEKLHGQWPNVVRGALFSVLLLPVVGLLLAPGRVAGFLERHTRIAPVLLPGVLLLAYTTNVKPMAYVALAVGMLLFLQVGFLHGRAASPWRRPRLDGLGALGIASALALLWGVATKSSEFFPRFLLKDPVAGLVVACLSVVAGTAILCRGPARRMVGPLGVALVVCVCLALRDHAPPWLGRSAIVVFAVAAVLVGRRGAWGLSSLLALASFAWVSRNFEVPAVMAFWILADEASRALARASWPEAPQTRLVALLPLVTFGFALAFLQRVAITGNLDIGSLDYRAGGFGDPNVAAWVIAAALVHKYALPLLVTWLLLTRRLKAELSGALALGLVVAQTGRIAVIVLMLFFCGDSYWTALRVLSELPFALLALAVAVVLWGIARLGHTRKM